MSSGVSESGFKYGQIVRWKKYHGDPIGRVVGVRKDVYRLDNDWVIDVEFTMNSGSKTRLSLNEDSLELCLLDTLANL